MTSTAEAELPEFLVRAGTLVEALTRLSERGYRQINIGYIHDNLLQDDGDKLRRILSQSTSVESFIHSVARMDSDFRFAVVSKPNTQERRVQLKKIEQPSFVSRIDSPSSILVRRDEVEALEIIMAKRTKNNVILCGPPGCGKTFLVEALAASRHKFRPFWRVDLASLVCGTENRGSLESRFTQLFDFAVHSKGTLFVDEIHALSRMGSAEGALNVLDLLKPYLVDSGFRMIGATTPTEVASIFEDQAFQRRFTFMELPELSNSQIQEIFLDYVKGSAPLEPFIEQFSTIERILESDFSETSKVDRLVDFLEYIEAYASMKYQTFSDVDSPGVLVQIEKHYARYRYRPNQIQTTR